MFNILDIVSKSSFIFIDNPKNKKNVFSIIAEKAAENYNLKHDILFNSLFKREKLGSTSVGNGIAIPHGLIDSFNECKCIISILSNGIDFDSFDNANVDLIFLLLMPKSNNIEHLQILASISRLLRNSELTNKLRGCKNAESAIAILSKIIQDKAA